MYAYWYIMFSLQMFILSDWIHRLSAQKKAGMLID